MAKFQQLDARSYKLPNMTILETLSTSARMVLAKFLKMSTLPKLADLYLK